MATIKFQNLSKSYGHTSVIKDINLIIHDKEFMVLVGPSGCGKSTLLRMIAGLEDISEGKLMIDDRIVNDLPPKDRDIAIVFQNYALYPHMTAFDNLAFGLKIRKMDKKVIHQKVMDAAQILEITDLLDRKPKAMSGGQRQRVAIGRAIVRDPKVFLFDEPLSNLDAKLRTQMRIEIARLHKKLQTTVVYVTHDQVEAMTLGDRIAVMNHGIIQQLDTPSNIYRFPANLFVAGFIGSPPMNIIEGQYILNEGKYYFENTTGEIRFPIEGYAFENTNSKLYLGIRPEHFFIKNNENESSVAIKVNTNLTENTGFESFTFGTVGSSPLTGRFTAEQISAEPDTIAIWYAKHEHLHFFDGESGNRISPITLV